MQIFSISDLHLSGKADKPMNVFGDGWTGHFEKIKTDWNGKVSDGDIVLLCGDTSWGTALEEGLFDLESLKELKKSVYSRKSRLLVERYNQAQARRARRHFLLSSKRLR